MVEAIAEADGCEQRTGAGETCVARNPGIDHWELDVLQRAGASEKVEGLKHESDAPIAHRGERVVGERRHLISLETIRATRCAVEAAENIHERGLAGAGRSHHGHELPRANSAEMPVSAR